MTSFHKRGPIAPNSSQSNWTKMHEHPKEPRRPDSCRLQPCSPTRRGKRHSTRVHKEPRRRDLSPSRHLKGRRLPYDMILAHRGYNEARRRTSADQGHPAHEKDKINYDAVGNFTFKNKQAKICRLEAQQGRTTVEGKLDARASSESGTAHERIREAPRET